MRRLALHASALSDAEYDLYTTSLRDIALADDEGDSDDRKKNGGTEEDDTFYENMVVGVREARAWLRGRYSHLSSSIIDGSLRLFSPNLAAGDTISGSEFFAVLRLVSHAENGRMQTVERSLAFVQAVPSSSSTGYSASLFTGTQTRSTPSTSLASSPAKRHAELPPPMPSRKSQENTTSKASDTLQMSFQNPFSPSSIQQHPQPPLHPSQRSDSSKSVTQHSANNPFIPKKLTQMAPPPPPPRSEDGQGSSNKLPPLPPRKPPPPIPSTLSAPPAPPPRYVSRTRADRSSSPSKRDALPPTMTSKSAPGTSALTAYPTPAPPSTVPVSVPSSKPPIPLPQHVTSNLMKQSLQASKVAQSIKKAEEQLEKERVMQVLKSSSVVSGTNIHNHGNYPGHGHGGQVGHHQHQHQQFGRSPSPMERRGGAYTPSSASSASTSTDERAPPLPLRRIGQASSSASVSTNSLEQVALATAPTIPPPPPSAGSGSFSRSRTLAASSDGSNYALSPFRSPVDPIYLHTDSPSQSPIRTSFGQDVPTGPPPTHPDRKPHLPFQSPSSKPQARTETNLQAFDEIYGPSSLSSPVISPSPSISTPSTPNLPHARVFRSKSLHQTSPPSNIAPLQPPPVRRRRPESVQVSGNGEVLLGSLSRKDSGSPNMTSPYPPLTRNATFTIGTGTGQSHLRRSSLSTMTYSAANSASPFNPSQPTPASHAHESPLHHIQRTIVATLQPKLEGLNIQPRLDTARYKAEAGLSKRGFVRDPMRSRSGVEGEEEEGLVNSRNAGRVFTQRDIFDDPQVDSGEDGEDGWAHSHGVDNGKSRQGSRDLFDSSNEDLSIVGGGMMGVKSARGVEADNMKWPAGEGWKPL